MNNFILTILLFLLQTREAMKSHNRKEGKVDAIPDTKVSSYTGRNHASLAWLYALINMTDKEVLEVICASCRVRY